MFLRETISPDGVLTCLCSQYTSENGTKGIPVSRYPGEAMVEALPVDGERGRRQGDQLYPYLHQYQTASSQQLNEGGGVAKNEVFWLAW